MDKGAATAASREQDESAATAEALLRSETFQQRMERARKDRERILRQSPPDPGRPDGSSNLSKPWDRQDRLLGSVPPAKAADAKRKTRSEPHSAAAVPLFIKTDAGAPQALPRAALAAVDRPPARPRRIGLRIALGFALGVTAGLVISRLPLPSLPDLAGQSARDDHAPADLSTTIVAATPEPRSAEPGPQTGAEPNLGGVRPSGGDPTLRLPAADASHRIASVALLAAPSRRDEPAPSTDIARLPLPLSPTTPSSLGSLPAPERAPTLPVAPRATVSLSPLLLATPRTDRAPAPDIAALPPQPAPAPVAPDMHLAGLSIHLHSATSDPAPTEDALAVLSAAGAPVVDQDLVGFKVSASHLRYYNAEDAGAALDLANALQIEARDFTRGADRPPRGFIEVWLAGSGAGAAPAPSPTKKKVRAAQSGPSAAEQAEAEALKQRLILMLQSGG